MSARRRAASVWQLQVAKNKLSEVVDRASRTGPQVITRRGVAIAVVVGVEDYGRLTRAEGDLADFFLSSPLSGSGLDLSRSRDRGRDADIR